MRNAGMTLGEALQRAFSAHQGRHLEEAERMYAQIIRAEPKCFDALHLLGVLKAERGHQAEAERLIRKALAVNPRSAEALNNRANVLQSLRRYQEALTSCEKALQIKPDYPEALSNRGNILHDLRRHDDALESYEKALAIRPHYAKALANRAEVLRDLHRVEEALDGCDQALAIDPNLPEALNNRGMALRHLRRHDESLASYDRALAIRPDYVNALANRAQVLGDLGRYDEALASYERALGFRSSGSGPARGQIYSEYLLLKRQICDWTGLSQERNSLVAMVDAGSSVLPFVLLAWVDDPTRQRHAARHLVSGLRPDQRSVLPERPPARHDKIRLCYLSPDFREHAVAYLTAELFELHDRNQFELYAVSLGPDDRSATRERLSRSFDHFIEARQVSDLEIARQMRALEIDVAVDLAGLTEGARPGVLAYRPAPIQVNYLGYPGTMGADFVDYIVVDPFVAPLDQQKQFSERLVHLPDCYQVNDRARPIADRTPTRAECGLPEQGFVFACFNNSFKLGPAIFDVWMRLLKAVPGSVLWLLSSGAAARMNLRKEAQARGVSSDRLVFAERLPLAEHVARHRLADLFLDTAPYGAHVTASDALWAGLPVLTCAGAAFASRVAGSLLRAVGLPELVTSTLDDYEVMAMRLSRDPALLSELRARLERNRSTAPLFDTTRFCRYLESAYREMYVRWQQRALPASFAVPAIGSAAVSLS